MIEVGQRLMHESFGCDLLDAVVELAGQREASDLKKRRLKARPVSRLSTDQRAVCIEDDRGSRATVGVGGCVFMHVRQSF